MTDKELTKKIISNIQNQHSCAGFKAVIKEILLGNIGLNSSRIFWWEDTPEGYDFWSQAYYYLEDSGISLRNLVYTYFIGDEVFIDLEYIL